MLLRRPGGPKPYRPKLRDRVNLAHCLINCIYGMLLDPIDVNALPLKNALRVEALTNFLSFANVNLVRALLDSKLRDLGKMKHKRLQAT